MSNFRLDSNGIQELLNSAEVAALVKGAAEDGAAAVRAQKPDADVVVDTYTTRPSSRLTERAAASVTIREPQARLWQARDGVLTKAMAGLGLEVTEK